MARGVAEDGVLIADILLGILAVLVIMGHYFRYSRLQMDLHLDKDMNLVVGVVATEPGVSSVAVVHSQAQGLVLVADLSNKRRLFCWKIVSFWSCLRKFAKVYAIFGDSFLLLDACPQHVGMLKWVFST